jgi:hypothetical protein
MVEKSRSRNAGETIEPRPARHQDEARAEKPGSTTTGSELLQEGPVAGQLALDDRGNISWEWSDDPQLKADDLLGKDARLRALAPRDLVVEDDKADFGLMSSDPVATPRKPQSGYNPYNSGEPTKQSWKKKRDLREFSKWIALKKRMRDTPGAK